MAVAPKDRLALLEQSTTLNGIDFVEIARRIRRPCRSTFSTRWRWRERLRAASITGGETIPTVAVNPINDATDWGTDSGRPFLPLTVAARRATFPSTL